MIKPAPKNIIAYAGTQGVGPERAEKLWALASTESQFFALIWSVAHQSITGAAAHAPGFEWIVSDSTTFNNRLADFADALITHMEASR